MCELAFIESAGPSKSNFKEFWFHILILNCMSCIRSILLVLNLIFGMFFCVSFYSFFRCSQDPLPPLSLSLSLFYAGDENLSSFCNLYVS